MQTSYAQYNAPALEGMIADSDMGTFRTSKIAVTGGIPVGRLVVFDPDAVSVNVERAYLPSAITDVSNHSVGVSVLDMSLQPTSGNDALYKAGMPVQILRRGRIWVLAEDIITAPGPVHARALNGAGVNPIGRFRGAADGVNTGIVPSARFLTITTAVDQLVLLELNLP